MRSNWPKLLGISANIALLLHLDFNLNERGSRPDPVEAIEREMESG